ncbi:hypothetical protein BDQ17DRAFT_1344689 [Cyathus striatus]|nr:hypothetical protein BDQ17DRAFT_1344689 [Cyathus striatus]
MVVTAIEAFGIFAAVTQKLGAVRIYASHHSCSPYHHWRWAPARHQPLHSEDTLSLSAQTRITDVQLYSLASGALYHKAPLPRRELVNGVTMRGLAAAGLKFSLSSSHPPWQPFSHPSRSATTAKFKTPPVLPTLPCSFRASRVGAFPSHYNPPYDAGGYGGYPGYGQPPNYRPPPGPPPPRDDPFNPPYDNSKPPGYLGGDGDIGYTKDDKGDDYGGPSAVHFR